MLIKVCMWINIPYNLNEMILSRNFDDPFFLVLSICSHKTNLVEDLKKKRGEMVYFSLLYTNTTQSWWLLSAELILCTYYLIFWVLWGHWRRRKKNNIKTCSQKWRKLCINCLCVGDGRTRTYYLGILFSYLDHCK